MVSLRKVFLPLSLGLQGKGNVEGEVVSRRRGAVHWSHPGFFGGPACLAPVAGDAGADHILPGLLTTPVAGNNVVQGKLSGFLATILAGVSVTVKNLQAGQPSFRARAFNYIGQPNYRGQGKLTTD